MAINWGNIVNPNMQDTSGNVASGNQVSPNNPSGANNPNLSAQNQLANIVANQQNLQNQAGTPAYEKKGHKFEKFMQVPQGGQMTQAQQAIADFYGPSTANAYQQQLQNFIQSNPANMQVYKDSGLTGAGLNAFMTTAPEALAEKSMFMQGLKSLTGAGQNVFDKISNAYIAGKDKLAEGVDKTMGTAEAALNTGVDIFKDAIAEKPKQTGSTFSAQSTPGASPLSGIPSLLNTTTDTAGAERLFKLPGNFPGDFSNQYFLGTSPSTESFKDNYLVRDPDINAIFGQPLASNTQSNLPNQFDVAELTQEQKDFMNKPSQSLEFQSEDSLFNKIKQLEDKGFFGFGAQEPTTREEFDEFIQSGGIAQAANGGMMGGIASLNNPEYQRLMGASNFGF